MTRPKLYELFLICAFVGLVRGEPMKTGYDQQPLPEGGFQKLQEQVEIPTYAMLANWETSLLLSFRIETNGEVSDIRVLESGGQGLDQVAIKAITQVKWQPAMIAGQPVPVRFELPFRFCCR